MSECEDEYCPVRGKMATVRCKMCEECRLWMCSVCTHRGKRYHVYTQFAKDAAAQPVVCRSCLEEGSRSAIEQLYDIERTRKEVAQSNALARKVSK